MVNYILDKGKDAKILFCDGLFAEDRDTIAMSFEAQSKMNPKVTKPVGHISLAFHKEDEHRLTDRTMAGIALTRRFSSCATSTRSIRTCI